MRRRYSINDQGAFVDRHGQVLREITSITIESAGPIGGSSFEGKEQHEITDPIAPQTERIWQHYCDTFEPRDTTLHPQERAIIRDALKVATEDECCRAIDGNKASPFHQGENDRRKRYNRLSHILKGKRGVRTVREQIDLFLDVLGDKRGAVGASSAVRSAMLTIRQAEAYPFNRPLQERAEKAHEVLAAAGWKVLHRSEDGRLDFERAT